MLIKVRVITGSDEDRVEVYSSDTCDVYVRALPQNGHANRLASYLLSKHFSCGVRLVSGGTQSHKIFELLAKKD